MDSALAVHHLCYRFHISIPFNYQHYYLHLSVPHRLRFPTNYIILPILGSWGGEAKETDAYTSVHDTPIGSDILEYVLHRKLIEG